MGETGADGVPFTRIPIRDYYLKYANILSLSNDDR